LQGGSGGMMKVSIIISVFNGEAVWNLCMHALLLFLFMIALIYIDIPYILF
jgi:hypothetical protein